MNQTAKHRSRRGIYLSRIRATPCLENARTRRIAASSCSPLATSVLVLTLPLLKMCHRIREMGLFLLPESLTRSVETR